MEKTNVMRILAQKKIGYKEYYYGDTGAISGADVAKALGEDSSRVFKTLVTVGRTKQNYVFMIPVEKELDLKKCAEAVQEKSIEMIPQKDLLPLTGYVHGGCSPIGMKKQFPTYIHESCLSLEKMYVSAGLRGLQICIAPVDLIRVVKATTCPLFQEP